jgi:hypothetical protein
VNTFAKNKITMVVARCKENLDWLKDVQWNYIVYNKGGNLPKWIKNQIKLRNIGREAHTYLTYIINNYDNLPDHTIFAQGNPFDHVSKFTQNIHDFDEKTNFFPLSDCVCSEKFENPNEIWPELAKTIRKLFLDDIASFKHIEYPEGAQFIVSKKAILFHSKMTYQKLLASVMEAEIFDDQTPNFGYRVFSTKFPEGRKRLLDTKMTRQEIMDSLVNEPEIIKKTGIFEVNIMEALWKTLFDIKHKTIYD